MYISIRHIGLPMTHSNIQYISNNLEIKVIRLKSLCNFAQTILQNTVLWWIYTYSL